MVLGLIATCREQPQNMRSYHQAAIRENPGAAVLHANYATSLAWSGYLEESIGRLAYAEHLAATDPEMLIKIAEEYFALGRLETAEGALDHVKEFWPQHEALHPIVDIVAEAKELLRRDGHTEQELHRALTQACEVMQDQGIYLCRQRMDPVSTDEERWLHHTLKLPTRGPEEAAELNEYLIQWASTNEVSILLQGTLMIDFEGSDLQHACRA